MSKVKILVLKIAKAGLKALYLPMKLLPTQKKVTFISRQSNTPSVDIRVLVDEVKKVHPDCKVAVLTRQLSKTPGYLMHVICQLYHIATSKTVILDSYCIPVSVLNHKKDLRVIQMWHAIGSMKHFGYAMIGKGEGHSEEVAEIMRMHKNYTYVLISSYDFINDFLIGFRIAENKILELPLPRADLLTDPKIRADKKAEMFEKYPVLKNKINILYCPTFRKIQSSVSESGISNLLNSIDFDKYNLIYKPHTLSDLKIEDERVITAGAECFDMMFAADYMISDYSSIIYEAGLLGIPVFLYAYDWDDYKDKRTFNLDLEKDIPALFTADPAEIMQCIENNKFDKEAFDAYIRKNVKMTDERCASRIVKLMNI